MSQHEQKKFLDKFGFLYSTCLPNFDQIKTETHFFLQIVVVQKLTSERKQLKFGHFSRGRGVGSETQRKDFEELFEDFHQVGLVVAMSVIIFFWPLIGPKII